MITQNNYQNLSEAAQRQVNAIVSGKGLGTKEGYAEALEYVNNNPELRAASVGDARPYSPSQYGKTLVGGIFDESGKQIGSSAIPQSQLAVVPKVVQNTPQRTQINPIIIEALSPITKVKSPIEYLSSNPIQRQIEKQQESRQQFNTVRNQFGTYSPVVNGVPVPATAVPLPVSRTEYALAKLPEVTGNLLGKGLSKVLPEEGLYTIPAQNKTVYIQSTIGTTVKDLTTGKDLPYFIPKEIKIEPTTFFSSKQGKAAGEFIGGTIPYLVPYLGEAVALSQIDLGIAESGGLVPYIKEKPLEAAGNIIFLGTEGALKLKSKTFPSTENRLLEDAPTIYKGQEDLTVNPIATKNEVPKVSFVKNIEETPIAFVKKANKGDLLELEYYPKDSTAINIFEERKVPLFQRTVSISKEGIKLSPPTKIFEGQGIITPDFFYSETPYKIKGVDYLKTIKTDNTGKGLANLYRLENDNWKLLSQQQVSPAEAQAQLNKLRTIKEVNQIEKNLFSKFIKKEVIVNGKKVTLYYDREGNLLVDELGRPTSPKTLSSLKITGEETKTIERARNTKAGIFRTDVSNYFFSDVIGVDARKGLITYRNQEGKLVTRKLQTGQDILYGNPNEVDVTLRGEQGQQAKAISPRISRITEEGAKTGFVEMRIPPNTRQGAKLLKKLAKGEIKIIRESIEQPSIAKSVQEAPVAKELTSTKSRLSNQELKDLNTQLVVSKPELKGAEELLSRTKAKQIPSYRVETTNPELRFNAKVKSELRDNQRTESNPSIKLESKPSEEIRLDNKIDTNLAQSPQERVSQENFSTQVNTQLTQQNTQQRTRQRTRVRTEPRFETPNELRTNKSTSKGKIKKRLIKINQAFEAFGRRYGIDKSLGKFETEKEASNALTKFAKEGLGASGFVTDRGNRVPFSKLGLSSEFTPSKAEFGRAVQRRGARLSSGGERVEIKQAKRGSSRKVKWI